MESDAVVTAAEIARLAGVGRAAVSNWRKRYATFPAPVAGSASSPEFDLAEVEGWLSDQGKLPTLSGEDRLWRHLLSAAETPRAALAAVGEHLLGGTSPFPALDSEISAVVAELGPREALDAMWRRFADLSASKASATPAMLAELMVALAGAAATVFDPACGTGGLLRAAVRAGATAVHGQDVDRSATRLIEQWLTLHEIAGAVRVGDSLRHDAFGDLSVDAVLSNPPFGLAKWGHEELGDDRRWEFGLPPRTEPELAWVQHAVAHLRLDGRAVLLMPPSAASRRAGRRIRAELLRRGVLRAVIALPPGAAAPHAVPLHLWVLRRTRQSAPTVLLVDAAHLDLEDAYRRIRRVVADYLDGSGDATDPIAHVAPVIDLLDEDVDLAPGRRTPPADDSADVVRRLRATAERLAAVVGRLPTLVPGVLTEAPDSSAPPTVTVGELIRSGRLQFIGPVRAGEPTSDDRPVLTAQDVVLGRAASGLADTRLAPEATVRPGDVVVPLVARTLAARVVTDGGPLLGRNLVLLRPDPQTLDPWFLAGHLRTSANERLAGSLAGTLRLDIRKAQVPRIPIEEQRRHGVAFRRLHEFDDAVREVTLLGADLARMTADGLAGGRVHPVEDSPA